MNGKIRMLRATALVFALALAVGACSGYARTGSHPTPPPSNLKYGSGVSSIPDVHFQSAKPGAKTGVLNLQVLDDANKPLPGAIVRYKGPQKGQAVTDSRGEIHVSLKPGSYEIDLAPCGTTVITRTQATASAFIVAGARSPLEYLNGISWNYRFKPSDQGRVSSSPPWKIGQTIGVGLAVEDGCTFGLAKGLPLPTFQWKLSSGFTFVGAPVYRTDATGFANATVRCLAKPKGVESIVLFDRAVPKNSADIMLATSSPPAGHDWCE